MKKSIAALLLGTSLVVTSSAADRSPWPNWRGPNSNGVAEKGTYLSKWDKESNVAWSAKLAGRGASTPIVVGEQIIVTSSSDVQNLIESFDFNGKKLWAKELGAARTGKHKKATGSNSSPVTDGKNIYVYYKSGDLACLSLTGTVVWTLNLQQKYGEDTLWWDLGTSPVLTDDAVVIAVMQSGPSFLLALDKQSGNEKWKANRVLEAPDEANQSYSTPIVTQLDGQSVLLTLGADHFTCHSASSGALLWKVGGFNPTQQRFFRSIASPVRVGDLVVCPYARGKSLTAIRLNAKDDASRIAWQRDDLGSDVPTPTFSGNRLYVVGDRGQISCLNVETGETIWSEELPKSRMAYSSSPVVANAKVYVTREDATTFVVRDANTYELISENAVPGETVATPVFANNLILLRTYDRLYAIGATR